MDFFLKEVMPLAASVGRWYKQLQIREAIGILLEEIEKNCNLAMFVTFIVGRPSPPPNLYCLSLSSSLSSSSSSHHLHHHHYHHNHHHHHHHQSSYHLHHLFLRLSLFVIRSYYIIRGSSETQKSRPTSALTRRRQRNVLKT